MFPLPEPSLIEDLVPPLASPCPQAPSCWSKRQSNFYYGLMPLLLICRLMWCCHHTVEYLQKIDKDVIKDVNIVHRGVRYEWTFIRLPHDRIALICWSRDCNTASLHQAMRSIVYALLFNARWFAVIGAFRSSLLFRLTDDVSRNIIVGIIMRIEMHQPQRTIMYK